MILKEEFLTLNQSKLLKGITWGVKIHNLLCCVWIKNLSRRKEKEKEKKVKRILNAEQTHPSRVFQVSKHDF